MCEFESFPENLLEVLYEMYSMLVKSIDMLFRVVDFNQLNLGGLRPEM